MTSDDARHYAVMAAAAAGVPREVIIRIYNVMNHMAAEYTPEDALKEAYKILNRE